MPYRELGCTYTFQGQTFVSDGAVVTDEYCVAYLGELWNLTDWHGKMIGTYRIVASWKTPRSYMSSSMHQVEAKIDGVIYTGRSAGKGMIFKGKRCKTQRKWSWHDAA